MKFTKLISTCLVFSLFTGTFTPIIAFAQESESTEQNTPNIAIEFEKTEVSNLARLGEYVSLLNDEQFHTYIFDTDNFLQQDTEFNEIFDSLSDEEKTGFWESISIARTPITPAVEMPEQTRFAPIVYFIASQCVRIISSRLAQATITFTAHAVIRANERGFTTTNVANAIITGRKIMDQSTRARAIYDSNQNIIVIFVGNTKEVATMYAPTAYDMAFKFVNSNWRW